MIHAKHPLSEILEVENSQFWKFQDWNICTAFTIWDDAVISKFEISSATKSESISGSYHLSKISDLELLASGFQILSLKWGFQIKDCIASSSYFPLSYKNAILVCSWEPVWKPALMASPMLWGLGFAEWHSACLASARLWIPSTGWQEKRILACLAVW